MEFLNCKNKSGYLEIIMGPMFAGKSTELLRIINLYKCLDKSVTVINHKINNRYGESTSLITHDKNKITDCLVLSDLSNLENDYRDKFDRTDVIIIEELQFFENSFDTIIKWVDIDSKIVICAGLDGDYNRAPFGDLLKLIPYSNKVKKLSALCKSCGDGTLAHFTKRITKCNSITHVGGEETYTATCRHHYLNDN